MTDRIDHSLTRPNDPSKDNVKEKKSSPLRKSNGESSFVSIGKEKSPAHDSAAARAIIELDTQSRETDWKTKEIVDRTKETARSGTPIPNPILPKILISRKGSPHHGSGSSTQKKTYLETIEEHSTERSSNEYSTGSLKAPLGVPSTEENDYFRIIPDFQTTPVQGKPRSGAWAVGKNIVSPINTPGTPNAWIHSFSTSERTSPELQKLKREIETYDTVQEYEGEDNNGLYAILSIALCKYAAGDRNNYEALKKTIRKNLPENSVIKKDLLEALDEFILKSKQNDPSAMEACLQDNKLIVPMICFFKQALAAKQTLSLEGTGIDNTISPLSSRGSILDWNVSPLREDLNTLRQILRVPFDCIQLTEKASASSAEREENPTSPAFCLLRLGNERYAILSPKNQPTLPTMKASPPVLPPIRRAGKTSPYTIVKRPESPQDWLSNFEKNKHLPQETKELLKTEFNDCSFVQDTHREDFYSSAVVGLCNRLYTDPVSYTAFIDTVRSLPSIDPNTRRDVLGALQEFQVRRQDIEGMTELFQDDRLIAPMIAFFKQAKKDSEDPISSLERLLPCSFEIIEVSEDGIFQKTTFGRNIPGGSEEVSFRLFKSNFDSPAHYVYLYSKDSFIRGYSPSEATTTDEASERSKSTSPNEPIAQKKTPIAAALPEEKELEPYKIRERDREGYIRMREKAYARIIPHFQNAPHSELPLHKTYGCGRPIIGGEAKRPTEWLETATYFTTLSSAAKRKLRSQVLKCESVQDIHYESPVGVYASIAVGLCHRLCEDRSLYDAFMERRLQLPGVPSIVNNDLWMALRKLDAVKEDPVAKEKILLDNRFLVPLISFFKFAVADQREKLFLQKWINLELFPEEKMDKLSRFYQFVQNEILDWDATPSEKSLDLLGRILPCPFEIAHISASGALSSHVYGNPATSEPFRLLESGNSHCLYLQPPKVGPSTDTLKT